MNDQQEKALIKNVICDVVNNNDEIIMNNLIEMIYLMQNSIKTSLIWKNYIGYDVVQNFNKALNLYKSFIRN